ncbi:ABC transporter ATP-binding protein [Compostimonas suwonensis]|uniref:ABC-type dipeptide/oligopeptide/nickel transport system ATPase component n=1 Tax=Compostimonas suwonensis TaxID=1048394 RepID=A0A2M9BZ21_9MICO|nr:ABC transporter ATP-binding protein [Compostimonas suwonensis]PJJ63325.1 ABC-type dipeptide/oligopeptide/nickel transport system ATPase component [Compostimonas suwonensis]
MIRISDLTVEYPSHGASPAHLALCGLSATVADGEVLGVLGEAGSGKSTLARVLAGDATFGRREGRPVITGGDSSVLEFSLRHMKQSQHSKYTFHVGHLTQDAGEALPPTLTVSEAISEPVLLRDRRYNRQALGTRVATLLDAVRLPLGIMDSFPYELSGGQRQRVAIARALVLDPRVFIADEPTAGIDVTVRDSVIDVLNELREERGFSAVVISHDVTVLRRATTHVAVLYRGGVVGYGPIDEVLADPRHPYVAGLAESFASNSRGGGSRGQER